MRLSSTLLFSFLSLSLAGPLPALKERETALNAFLAILLDDLPVIDGDITEVSDILTVFEDGLALLTGETTTQNQLSASDCKEYTVLFARGTTEPGNVGVLVGPPFFDALESIVGTDNLAIQGVNDYTPSVENYLAGGDPVGSAEMAVQIQQVQTDCPSTKLIVSGYSQGGQLVHNAIGAISADLAAFISKVVIFGDPDSAEAIPNVSTENIDIICHAGDNICVNGDLILVQHLTYAENALAAATFATS